MDMKSKVSPIADDNEEPKTTVLGYPPNSKQPPHLHYPGGGYPPAPYNPQPGYPPPYAAGPPGYPNMGNHPPHLYQYPPSMPNYYNAPTHPGYYNSTQLPPNFGEYEPDRDQTLARAILCLLLFLIIVTTTVCVAVPQMLTHTHPTFDVSAFAVPSFNLSDTSLVGKWEATFAVANDERGVELAFEHVEARVSYNDILLANTVAEPFELKKSSKVLVPARLETPAKRHVDGAGDPPFKLMKSELDRDGSLTFGLALDGILSFGTNVGKTQQMAFGIECHGLKTHFKDPGVGVWDGVKPPCVMHKN